MLKTTLKSIFPAVIILFISLACSLPSLGTPTVDPKLLEDQVATASAATITALASDITEQPPTATSEATEIVSPTETSIPEPTATESPTFAAPEFLRVVFSDRNGNLWACEEGGSPSQLIDSGDTNDVRISPDGAWITFTRSTGDATDISLWAIRFDGSNEHLLVSHADFMAMPVHPAIADFSFLTIYPWMMEFVPNSQTLAFNTAPQFDGPGFFDNKDLWLVDVESSARSALFAAGEGGQFYYSLDGSQIALVTPTDISLVNADGSNLRSSVLDYERVLTYSEYEYHAQPLWSPNGNYLKVIIPPPDPLGNPDALGHIYRIPADGAPASELGTLALAPLEKGSLSPDLNRIAYLQQYGEPQENIRSLMIANGDGSGSTEFVRGSLTFANWAPDSNHFAYRVWTPRALSLAAANDPGNVILSIDSADDLRWLPDNRFLFIYQADPEWQLHLVSLINQSSFSVANLGQGEQFPSYDFASP